MTSGRAISVQCVCCQKQRSRRPGTARAAGPSVAVWTQPNAVQTVYFLQSKIYSASEMFLCVSIFEKRTFPLSVFCCKQPCSPKDLFLIDCFSSNLSNQLWNDNTQTVSMQVIWEMMRNVVPIPFASRVATLDTELGGYFIPKNTQVRPLWFTSCFCCFLLVCGCWRIQEGSLCYKSMFHCKMLLSFMTSIVSRQWSQGALGLKNTTGNSPQSGSSWSLCISPPWTQSVCLPPIHNNTHPSADLVQQLFNKPRPWQLGGSVDI